jgi:hypothetical protein
MKRNNQLVDWLTGKLDHKPDPAQQGLIQLFFIVSGYLLKAWFRKAPGLLFNISHFILLQQIGGRRPAHGCASSSWAASLKRVASSPKSGPMRCSSFLT